MSTELTVTEPPKLVAVDAGQMISAHEQMRVWATSMVVKLRVDLEEEREVLRIATFNKWSVNRHRRIVRNLERRIDFFEKIHAALEAGYVIVPNFNMDVFAIRTDRAAPAPNTVHGSSWNVMQQTARVLPMSEGEYRNPQTHVHTDESEDGPAARKISYATGDWLDIEFPFALAKPLLMGRTAEALALRCFDEIGVAQDRQAGGDPYIIGRIRNPGQRADISFFIGWTFDPSAL